MKTITAQELRIGNYVSDMIYQKFIVSAIMKDKLIFKNAKGIFNIDLFYPIPLTAEWLEKFGFSDGGYKKGYIGKDFTTADGTMILDFVLTKPKIKGKWQDYYIYELEGFRFTPLHYVHQLQNLYYVLTGEELTLK